MTTCGGVLEEYLHFLCSYITKSYKVESNFVCHACFRAIICLLSFIFQPPAICYFYSALVLHTLHPYSHYCFLCMGISDSDAVLMNAEKKRQKSLQCNLKISTKRSSALTGAVSVVGDSKRSSAVGDLNCHTQPSQVLALTSRCQMWLHVAYGV